MLAFKTRVLSRGCPRVSRTARNPTFVIACTRNGGYNRCSRRRYSRYLFSRSEISFDFIVIDQITVLIFPIKIPSSVSIDRLMSPGNFPLTDANIHTTFRIYIYCAQDSIRLAFCNNVRSIMIRHFTTNLTFLAVLEFSRLNHAFTLLIKEMFNIIKRFHWNIETNNQEY